MLRLSLLLTLLVALPCRADLYEWTDASGQKHFSDSVPAGQEGKAKKHDVTEAPKLQSNSEAQSVRERQAVAVHDLDKKREAQEKAAADKAAAEKEQQDICAKLRSRDQFYSNGGRIFSTDANGERHYYTDDEVAQKRQELGQELQEKCSN